MEKTITLKRIGFCIKGIAWIYYWGSGVGEITMNPKYIPEDMMSKDAILKACNDAGFGCQGAKELEIAIYENYEGTLIYNRTISTTSKHHLKYFCQGI